jgi:chaperonin GroES
MAKKTAAPKTALPPRDPRLAPDEEFPDNPLAKCTPRHDRVVVRRDIAGERKVGRILLPDSFDSGKQQTGVVWAVGEGKPGADGKPVPLGLEVGQRVIITGWAGLEINDPMAAGNKNDEFVLLRDEDVVALLPAR